MFIVSLLLLEYICTNKKCETKPNLVNYYNKQNNFCL